ncbi:MAG TPA: hypothetical protein VGU23_10870 [Acidobacteriaceae bacterium]|nr:hypothetical protein [Acidobacteriaceae bacterium]
MAFAQLPTPPATPAAAVPPVAPIPAAHRAQVVYSAGQIEIAADDSSLQQILREIARVTGMKITGSVADTRVFGKYGPGAPAEIIARLLDGTDVNMLLKQTATGAPAELILTLRNGSATPPDPTAQQASAESVQQQEPDISLPLHGPGGSQDVVRDINGVAVSQGAVAPPAAPPTPPTPEQMQQRMQQMRQQQQQQMQQRQQPVPH